MTSLLLLLSTAMASVTASSVLTDAAGKHPAELAVDGLLDTAWGEAKAGSADGEWLELDLGKPTKLKNVALWPGNLSQGSKSYKEYSRPKTVRVLVDGVVQGKPVRLQDQMQRVDIPVDVTGRKVRFVVDETYDGIVFAELFITEVAVNFPDNDDATGLDKWLASKEAATALDKYNNELDAAYEKFKTSNGEDEKAWKMLTDAVENGPAFVRPKVKSLIKDGYRAQAIRSSERAQKALRKLKDANAIPSLELAALRATGKDHEALMEMVEIFQAYAELIGGGSANVPYWGQTGWEPGALQGFGEPINLEIDREGNVYAADIGNNRVQRFEETGRPDKVWGGGKADITDVWFEKGRKWYVTGSPSGEGPGQWMNALDIDLIPEKEGDGLVGIDAQSRVQIFDIQGRQRISWKVGTENASEPNLGGTAYVAYVPDKKRVYAFVGDEAVGYTTDSEEVVRFEIKDGTPNAVEVLDGNKFLFTFGNKVIEYALDGFRQGVVIDKSVLGEGFEDMDITLDESGALWVFTDNGDVFKFKKPGKLEFKLHLSDRQLKHPRIAVRQGILYMCSDDRIERIDVLQEKLDQEAAAAEKAKAEGGGETKKKDKKKKGGEEEE
jgi:hypothetical protein